MYTSYTQTHAHAHTYTKPTWIIYKNNKTDKQEREKRVLLILVVLIVTIMYMIIIRIFEPLSPIKLSNMKRRRAVSRTQIFFRSVHIQILVFCSIFPLLCCAILHPQYLYLFWRPTEHNWIENQVSWIYK